MVKTLKQQLDRAEKQLNDFRMTVGWNGSCPICKKEFKSDFCKHSYIEVERFLASRALHLRVKYEIERST